jgi:hypothetical protein
MKNVYFFYFEYKGMKMKGLNSSLIYIPYCKKIETDQEGYQEANTQTKMQGQPMKKMIRKKKSPENSTIKRFPITLQSLNS